ncbi:acetyl-CoA carboxylase biotin carboxyl carrier protein [Actinomadura barringtoniae]|uniref:Biotin carboxyl carrier protein of acetyl-CoA carboxylase n=1 Tax=Actinomadura barringtoniae TaxID=1427535 RepID=A0A939T0L4_9ACTN|nr:acetyl-CoA carboxylase biotin carboxyl carrier protein [Actinomadura barringtoniae]MBO2445566.1 acetyl-CoA carboxylase biotin carboxyl carrier protein [Actinomadura barringtoniae]
MSNPHVTDSAELTELYRLTSEFVGKSAGRLRRLKVNAGDASLELEWVDPADAGPAVQLAVVAATDAEEAAETGEHSVRAPLVGTFYRSPSPGEKAFVEVGDTVVAGQQVAILEAMKLMNSVEADRDGRVTAILVPDGTPVEYDQPLIVISED